MSDVIVFSLGTRFVWWMFDKLLKISFGRLKKKMVEWGNKQLQLGLQVIEEPKVILNGWQNKGPYLWITLNLWSSIPSRLYPHRIIGRVETKGFQTDFHWDKEGQRIHRHTIENIEPSKNNWMFFIQPPLEILKSNASSIWSFNFTAIFQHGLAKTFEDIKFKIRNSDVKILQEL